MIAGACGAAVRSARAGTERKGASAGGGQSLTAALHRRRVDERAASCGLHRDHRVHPHRRWRHVPCTHRERDVSVCGARSTQADAGATPQHAHDGSCTCARASAHKLTHRVVRVHAADRCALGSPPLTSRAPGAWPVPTHTCTHIHARTETRVNTRGLPHNSSHSSARVRRACARRERILPPGATRTASSQPVVYIYPATLRPHAACPPRPGTARAFRQ